MKKLFLVLFTINIFIVNCFAQTRLESAAKILDMEVNLPSSYSASQNKEGIYVTPVSDESPYPTIKQDYRNEPFHGPTAFKVFFGMVASILRHQDTECVVFIFMGDVAISTKGLMSKRPDLFSYESLTFNRIKWDFQYGNKYKGASKNDIKDLNEMITHYSKHKAKKMFNTDWAVEYPFNLSGEVYENKYNICKAVVAKKGERDMFLYFMLTEKGAKNFEKYLKELSGAFKFK